MPSSHTVLIFLYQMKSAGSWPIRYSKALPIPTLKYAPWWGYPTLDVIYILESGGRLIQLTRSRLQCWSHILIYITAFKPWELVVSGCGWGTDFGWWNIPDADDLVIFDRLDTSKLMIVGPMCVGGGRLMIRGWCGARGWMEIPRVSL